MDGENRSPGGGAALSFAARDGYPLMGTLYRPDGPAKGAVLVSGGTGFPARYYRYFAQTGAAQGWLVLTFDYRGIGGSAPKDLAALDMDYPDWGRLDMPAAIDALVAQAGDGVPVMHVGHSVGGHFIGFSDNQDKVKAHAFVCVGSGYQGTLAWWYRPLAAWFWHSWGAWSIWRHGILKSGGGWTGAPLPRGVFETWKRWCHQKTYYLDELQQDLRPHHFDELTAPIRSFLYTDDPIANDVSARVLLQAYPNAPSDIVMQAPGEFGLKAVGHNGPFTRKTAPAARAIWDWLEGQL